MANNQDESFHVDTEARIPDSVHRRGSWITLPFILSTVTGLTLAAGGIITNLIVYLIMKFNVKSIDAAQISNVVDGSFNLIPIAGAILADSFFGSFYVVMVSAFISLLGAVLLALTAMIDSLRPPSCEVGSNVCQASSGLQLGVLYAALALICVGIGGARYTIVTMGAIQLDKQEDQGLFFNWYMFTLCLSSAIGATVFVYVEDNVSWALGFGLCAATNFIGLAIFLLGNRFYRHDKPQGSPFVYLARVLVATIRKMKIRPSSRTEDYYHGQDGIKEDLATEMIKSFRFLNRAALITRGDLKLDGSVAKPWRLCMVEQVEDIKKLIRILPLWSSSILLTTTLGMQANLTLLQALTMDRHLGNRFTFPAGSLPVLSLISTSVFVILIDRLIYPLWRKLTSQFPSHLQRIGAGHLITILSMAVSAMVEAKRLKVFHSHQHQHNQTSLMVPLSVLWLFPQLITVGIGEAFHFPGQIALYYQEFPFSLRSTSTGMVALLIGIGYYLSTAMIDLIKRITSWLPNNLNDGRVDNVYWMLVVIGVLNFAYYLLCAILYKNQNADSERAAVGISSETCNSS